MQPKLMHYVRMQLRTAIFVLCLISSALVSKAQDTEKSPDASVSQAAPNLPAMVRATGKHVFHGEMTTYAIKENEASILAWVNKYPAEFRSYKASIHKYLETAQPESMRSGDKARYYDLKAQWVMIQQMNLTLEPTELKPNSTN